MYKFIITLQLRPRGRDEILARAPEVQTATRAEPGCVAYDFLTWADDPDRLVFVETWKFEAAHAAYLEENHTKAFIAFHKPKHLSLRFETINAER